MNFTLYRKIYQKLETAVRVFKSLRYSEYYKKYLGYYKDFKIYLEELSDLDFASFSYIPVFGWVIPLVLRKNNSFCIYHAKQGFVLFMLFVISAMSLNLISVFTPREYRILRFCIVLLIYAMYIAYIVLCIVAVNISRKGLAVNSRILKKFADMIEI